MPPNSALKALTGKRIVGLIKKDNKVIEDWNDAEGLCGENRDRLGWKEARFQSLLAQSLRQEGFGVIVESYFSKNRGGLRSCSCDVYAAKGNSAVWVEIKRQHTDHYYGGRGLIEYVLSDLGKMLAGKEQGDHVATWIVFWGDQKDIDRCFRSTSYRYNFPIRQIRPGQLKAAWLKKGSAKARIRKLLGKSGRGAMVDALLDIERWIKAHGGHCRKTLACKANASKEQWVSYGILCGML